MAILEVAAAYHNTYPREERSGLGEVSAPLGDTSPEAEVLQGRILSPGTDWHSRLEESAPAVLLEIDAAVDHGVLTLEEASMAPTLHGALARGREQDYGTLEPGKMASLVVLREDPTQDVKAPREVIAFGQCKKLHWRGKFEVSGNSRSPLRPPGPWHTCGTTATEK